ncbi:MAG: hypothetical protein ACBR50_26980 [Microcoleus sp.]
MVNIKLNLLDNGIDYIYESVRSMLKIPTNPQHSWKYSVLHLFSGIELLLKEKLKQEHWSLIFQDVREANLDKLKSGDFVSVYHEELIKRLKNISQITFNDEPIKKLQKLRNKFEHFEINISLEVIQDIVIEVLEEAINFWEEHLKDVSTDSQKEKFEIINSVLIEFEVYQNKKLNKFEKVMNEIEKSGNGLILVCTNCFSLSFAVFKDDEKKCKCFVCNETYSKNDYLKNIRNLEESGEVSLLWRDDPYDRNCSICHKETRIRNKFTDEISFYWCLNCLNREELDPEFNLTASILRSIANHSLEDTMTQEQISQLLQNLVEDIIN